MANIKSYPNNINQYIGAEEVMKWHHGRTSGVYAAGTNCAVAPVSGQMKVTVSDGLGWLTDASGNGIAWWNDYEKENSTKLQLTIDASESTGTLNRIDRIIVEWTIGLYDAVPVIRVLKGTSASSPVAPSLTNNTTVRQISLAKISIPAAATAITAAAITDERLNNAVCGLVSETIVADTSVANAQFTALLNAVQEELAELEEDVGVELKKRSYSNVTVGTGLFVADSTYEDYGYRADITLANMTGNDIPEVIFGYDAVKLGILAPFCESHIGGVYIYATEVPADPITIPTIIAWKP